METAPLAGFSGDVPAFSSELYGAVPPASTTHTVGSTSTVPTTEVRLPTIPGAASGTAVGTEVGGACLVLYYKQPQRYTGAGVL